MICLDSDALAAAFDARRCAICGKPAAIVCVGQEATWLTVHQATPDGSTRTSRHLVTSSRPDLNFCLDDAAARWSKPAPAMEGST